MIELLKGRISDVDGLKEALEIIATFKEVSSAVLEIEGEEVNGRIGVAWGKFITGALLNDGEAKGKPALRRLLRTRQGKFAYFDLEDEPPNVDLRQALGIDLLRTSMVVPNLDPREGHFLWDANEDPNEEKKKKSAPIIEADVEADHFAYLDEEPEKLELEPIVPSVEELAAVAPALHDSEPILPPPTAAVAEAADDASLPVPDVGEDHATAFDMPPPRQQPAQIEPEPAISSVLDQIFGGPAPWAERQAEPSLTEKGIVTPLEPVKSFENPELRPMTLADPIPAMPRLPQPESDPLEPEPDVEQLFAEPVRQGPMLQPNVVADSRFMGQRFVEPAGKVRPAPTTDNKPIAIAVVCLFLFVLSCAGTVILGPRAWQFITSVLHI